ncbi:MAG: hypothetical protein ACP5OZ_02960, partial [Candidatus Woesearchaeota archaeon]
DADATFRVYTSSGSAVTNAIDVDTNAGTCNAVSVSALDNVNFVFGYYDMASSDVTFRTYTSSGGAVSAITDVDTDAGVGSFSVSVSGVNSSHFVIGWYDQTSGYVRFRLYSVYGTIVGTEVVPDTAVGTTASGVMVSTGASSNQKIIFSWHDTTTDVGVALRTYNLDLTQYSSEIPVQSNSLRYNALTGYHPATGIGICDGNFVIAVVNSTTQAFFRTYYANGTEWNGTCSNSAPNITKIYIDDEITNPSGEIDLTAGSSKIVYCNGTISDLEGYDDIKNVSAVLYASGSGVLPTDSENNNTLYKNNTCSLSSGFETTKKNFSCAFNVLYYANNGTWTCNATTYDNSNAYSSSTNTTKINILVALNVSNAIIDYGILGPGETSPSSSQLTITNLGNIKIDLVLNGTNMSCNPIGSIFVENQHYNITGTDQSYDLMRALTLTPFTATDFDLDKRVTAESTRTTYWRIRIPAGVKGFCQGNITLAVQAG